MKNLTAQLRDAAEAAGLVHPDDSLKLPAFQQIANECEDGKLSPAAATLKMKQANPAFFKDPGEMSGADFDAFDRIVRSGARTPPAPSTPNTFKELDASTLDAAQFKALEASLRGRADVLDHAALKAASENQTQGAK